MTPRARASRRSAPGCCGSGQGCRGAQAQSAEAAGGQGQRKQGRDGGDICAVTKG